MNSVKKYILYGCVVASLIGTSSCDKDLDNIKKDVLTDATQWATENNADIAINDVYDQLPALYNDAENFDNLTDDNDPNHHYASWSWKDGNINPALSNYGINFAAPAVGISNINRHNWPALYQAIRKANLVIQQITLNKKNYTEAWYNKRLDEMRFHRAHHYSTLLLNWGGVPIITVPQTREDSAKLFITRSSFAETLDFITKSLDTILNNKYLEVKYNKGNTNAGRATLGAALMLKAYVQLVAASPLHNSATYPAGADPKKVVTFGDYNVNRWAAAAASFKKFMDDWGGVGKPYNLVPDDSTIWYESNEYNPEVIFDRQYVANIRGSSFEYYGGPTYVLGAYATWGNYNPTQELVDQFFMANGKPITDPTSGYDPQNPYVGREKRFYKWIVYDGAPHKMDWMSGTDTIYFRIDKVKKSLNEIDFGLSDNSNTGYNFKKKLNPTNRPGQGLSGANYVYFRYTEVLLGYAEAQNEAVGPDQSVYNAINAVRARVNLPALPAGLSQSQMRDAIRQERRVELCFENKRFFDIRRWKIAEDVMNKDLTGMKIENTVPANNSGVWKYTRVGLNHPHKFLPKQYMMPIPQPVIAQNPNGLFQNPGY